jgi:hypothetical protein
MGRRVSADNAARPLLHVARPPAHTLALPAHTLTSHCPHPRITCPHPCIVPTPLHHLPTPSLTCTALSPMHRQWLAMRGRGTHHAYLPCQCMPTLLHALCPHPPALHPSFTLADALTRGPPMFADVPAVRRVRHRFFCLCVFVLAF